MPDYSLGKIYKITAKNADEGDVYIGSTICRLCERLSKHKYLQSCSVKILIEKYGKDNIYIELIKDFPCETKQQLLREEGKYILETKCVNRQVAGRTQSEYRKIHKEKNSNYQKIYQKKEEQQIKKKIYRDEHKGQSQRYRDEHKEKTREYNKQYRELRKLQSHINISESL